MAMQTVESATAADEAAVVAVITLAFSTDPAARWTWPDPQRYLEYFPPFIKAFGGRAFARGGAHRADDYAGAALWLPPGVHPDEEAIDAVMERSVPENLRKDGDALFEQMARFHPREPLWYLPLIGVDPARQGRGYGAALLKHGLIACDRDGTAAYLESTNPNNIPLYERHGFELLGTIQAGTSPPLFPMLRRPVAALRR
jgi:ribosomal protein S18 acetylase RimI-like enzyme